MSFDFGAINADGSVQAETVEDADLKALAEAGADWSCAACGSGNRGDASACTQCGAEKASAENLNRAHDCWSNKQAETERERNAAEEEKEKEISKSQMIQKELVTARIVSRQHADGESALQFIYDAYQEQAEKKVSALESRLKEMDQQLKESQRIATRAQDGLRLEAI